MKRSVGILGIGSFLPEEVRPNDWWPSSIVDRWRDKSSNRITRGQDAPPPDMSEGGRKVYEAMAELGDDPFQGAIERRVAPEGMLSSDMEAAAARDALARAGVDAKDVDFVLTFSNCPDHLGASNACLLHERLGLPRSSFCMTAEAACNSFMMQLTLAEAMIASGVRRCGLLVQSSLISRMMVPDESFSVLLGDGATAVVVGAVPEGRGILGRDHRTDGSLHRALVFGVPDKAWYEEGRIVPYSPDPRVAYKMLTSIADLAQESAHVALSQAELRATDVDFYASHQATLWFRRVTQEYIGLDRARFVDTFAWAGSLSAANIPLQLAVAEREHRLSRGDVVLMHTGGTGIVWSSIVLRWGSE